MPSYVCYIKVGFLLYTCATSIFVLIEGGLWLSEHIVSYDYHMDGVPMSSLQSFIDVSFTSFSYLVKGHWGSIFTI